jgi:hypothetical protein
MQTINATGLDRKSGGAQWRDLRFSGPFLEMFFSYSRATWVATFEPVLHSAKGLRVVT